MHDLGYQRQGTYGTRADAAYQKKLWKIGWGSVRCGSKATGQASHDDIFWSDLMMVRHGQVGQQRLH